MLTWETHEGTVYGFAEDGSEVEISALQDRAEAAKWGAGYLPGRQWTIYDAANEIVATGREKDLRAAKKAATLALTKGL